LATGREGEPLALPSVWKEVLLENFLLDLLRNRETSIKILYLTWQLEIQHVLRISDTFE